MTRVAIVGATGYAGAELVRILSGHPETEITVLTSRQYAGVRFDHVYPAMAGRVDIVCQQYSADHICENADLIYMALPHKLPMAFVPDILKQGKKVVDLSADFRFNDVSLYESVYQPHTAGDLLDAAVYGLCEIYADQIKATDLVGNPGCYPTSVLLPLIPLLRQGLLEPASLIADSKSGVSGAGRSVSLATHFCEVNESFKAYKVAEHRHNPEMNAILSREANRPVSITFVPHLVPMTRGMLTTIYAAPISGVTKSDIAECYRQSYHQRKFVRLCPEDRLPDTRHVRGTNFCDIGFNLDENNRRLVLISAIDNLVKGAAGQAVQNMNLMLGFDETAGLLNVPYPV
ncbi:N-acetyl-gamma-glutamyl-phosphate reductase (EC [Olavius algarvensis Delta 1 endosymbiont]|nr:N-acetyl-gamma-glutamyl-phosphate reductase (EC [Olavius algarvensis Delta 1 endosymbiont]